ncbi:MAG: DEAD/DEAH box helicase [Phycisphaerales bacterium]
MPNVTVVNPFRVAVSMRRQYLEYLAESLPIHHTQTRLATQFRQQLALPDAFVREPLISAIPSYRTVQTPRQLFDRPSSPTLNSRMASLNPMAFQADRPLYEHQVRAITAIQAGRNVVVATGTGSGKTECFLLPLLDEALRSGKPSGVRAILVYPMNALANDQLDRLQSLIAASGVTFGRYTSQTPEEVQAKDGPATCPSEMRSRAEIRKQPPQLLLTNFAMLEYLLLRPDDQGIFRHNQVRYIVLDEAHSYTGAQGIDISLLMRKLKRKFGESVQFVLTSATLGDEGAEAAARIADFASRLTSAPFAAEDVIRGTRQNAFGPDAVTELSPAAVKILAETTDEAAVAEALGGVDGMKRFLERVGVAVQSGEGPRQMLFRSMKALAVASAMCELIIEKPRSVSDLAELLTDKGFVVTPAAIERLLVLATNARSADVGGAPMLSARVHQFFRGVAGACVYLSTPASGGPTTAEHVVDEMVLEDRKTLDEKGRYPLPLSVCHSCGFPFVVVREDGEQWGYPTLNDQEPRLALTWVSPKYMGEIDQEEGTEADEASEGARSLWLDTRTRDLLTAEPGSSAESVIRMWVVPASNDQGDIQTCPCCGAGRGAYPSVARAFITGDDAPTAVLAEELVRQLPEQDSGKPAGGRRLLAFSDSRQRAAFFAPYLSRTVAEASFVEPVLAAVRAAETKGGPRSIPELVEEAAKLARKARWVIVRTTDDEGYDCYEVLDSRNLRGQDERKLVRESALVLYQHMTSTPLQRTRLPRLMLAAPEFEIRPADVAALTSRVPGLFRDLNIGADAVQRLCAFLIRRLAIAFQPVGIEARELLPGGRAKKNGPLQVAVHRDPTGLRQPGMRIMRWNPYRAPQRSRTRSIQVSHVRDIVTKALRLYGEVQPSLIDATLEAVWDVFSDPDSPMLLPLGTGLFQVPAGAILVVSRRQWYRCETCDARTIHSLGSQCEVFECGGKLTPVADPAAECASKHLARRYQAEPLPLRVREHTAQLSLEHGREYQDEFKAGNSNVLSCSTTFEMGVDIGDLDSVLLRNVPPSTSSYLQRAGRAGRRNQSLAHAVTYSRSIPHDLHHFFSPLDMVAGRVPVPIVHTQNRILTQRHVNSLLLGRFLLWLMNSGAMKHFDKQPRSLGQFRAGETDKHLGFFPLSIDGPASPADLFGTWCQQHEAEILAEVRAFIPPMPGLTAEAAIAEANAMLFARDPVAAERTAWHKGLRSHLVGYQLQQDELKTEADKAWVEGDHKRAGALKQAAERVTRLAADICDQDLINFLASEHWLPNYAFPQDVVRLTVRSGNISSRMRLERSRDQGISEYAPGSEVIADGLSLSSVGIDLERREPRLESVSFLPGHRITISDAQDTLARAGRQAIDFIQPLGFTTNALDPPAPPNLFRRRPPPSTEVFLAEGAPDDAFVVCEGLRQVRSALGRDSRLFRANLGKQKRGFAVCLRCGTQRISNAKGLHDAPWGGKCAGQFRPLALAHDFRTAVLQIQFLGAGAPDVGDQAFWHTLAAAMSNAACDLLEISRSDLVAGYRASSETGKEAELYLYDRIPGGAGYAERIQERLVDVLERTRLFLQQCDNPRCDPNGSCYSCLRSFANQFHWEHLQRSIPMSWLERVLASRS